MNIVARVIRGVAKVRFRNMGLATIKDIPTERFNSLIQELAELGWRKVSEYDGVDAWIDYGCITMRRNRTKLKLEWDNWTEGSVQGPRRDVEAIANRFDFAVTHEWRWSEWDD